jgi:hypothetical protein
VKFFRAGRANLVESYAENGGIVLINAYIPAVLNPPPAGRSDAHP